MNLIKSASLFFTRNYFKRQIQSLIIKRSNKQLYSFHVFTLLSQKHRYNFCSKNYIKKDEELTFQLLYRNIAEKSKFADQLQRILSLEASQTSHDMSLTKQQMRKQINKLQGIRQIHKKLQMMLQSVKQIDQMMKQSSKEDAQILRKEKQQIIQQIEINKRQAIELLLPPDIYDDSRQVIVEFKPGAGGLESSIFIDDLYGMYSAFFQQQGWSTKIISSQKQIQTKTYKFLNIKVVGQNVHKILKSESGVHKVIRIPETQSKGRLQSSTASVVIIPVVPFNFSLDPKDIKYQYTRSSGPGGQGVNKIQSACRAIHIPTGITVFIQQQRSQQSNKKRATEILKQKIFQIQYQNALQKQKKARKSQVTTLDRSEKIRTYNFPQDRITDHRTGLTLFGMNSMLKGMYIKQFIDSWSQKLHQQKIDNFIDDLYENYKQK